MREFSVIRASAFRALRPFLFDKLVVLELVTDIKEKYGFLRAPDGSANQPVAFQAGKFQHNSKSISIEELFATYVGNSLTSLGAMVRTSTNDADAFLDDLKKWVGEKYSLDTTETKARAYFSQVEFVVDEPLNTYFPKVQQIANLIVGCVKGYGLTDCPPFEFGGFSIHYDAVTYDSVKPSPQPFAIERRVQSPYGENKYFSQAPLSTDDHRMVLEKLETILRS
jgi:hypothetical protein